MDLDLALLFLMCKFIILSNTCLTVSSVYQTISGSILLISVALASLFFFFYSSLISCSCIFSSNRPQKCSYQHSLISNFEAKIRVSIFLYLCIISVNLRKDFKDPYNSFELPFLIFPCLIKSLI